MTAVVGSLTGLSMLLGAVIGQISLVAVGGIVALAVGAAWLAGRSRPGTVAVTLCVPLVGVGLSDHTDLPGRRHRRADGDRLDLRLDVTQIEGEPDRSRRRTGEAADG